MAHSRTARKRVRQNVAARALNRWRLSTMRTAIKEFNELLMHGTVDQASEQFRKCVRVIDRTAQKGVIHKNQAARRKSRMSARLKAKKTASAA
ncbi:MAG: 30S ribosomal protein S20 [Phycisphaeraceae bacterium]|nr:30S ribosomal protein S20 [Phycisphaeraceae bacterium]MBX3409310.1 30S ribosomal protein S20 [Phycisphaeraceae bacterium]